MSPLIKTTELSATVHDNLARILSGKRELMNDRFVVSISLAFPA